MKMDARMKRRILCILIIIICVLSLKPLVEISQYSRPAADDFNYARTTFKAWRDTHDITQVIKGAAETSVRFWNTWQGTYASAFLMSLQPGILGGEWYGLTGIFMMAIIMGSTIVFSIYFVKHILKCSLLEGFTLGVLMSTLMIQFMPSSIQGLFWFNGSIHYGFFFALLLIYICCLIELQRCVSGIKEIALLLVCLLIVFVLEGGNQITGLMSLVFTIVLLILQWKKEKRKTVVNVIILSFMLFCFYLNLGAPGTLIRLTAVNTNNKGIVQTIFTAAFEGIKSAGKWFGFKEVCVLVITSPILINISKRIKEKFGYKFSCPIVCIIVSVAWISLMYCPTLYAQGITGDERLINIVYYSFVILVFINAIYIMGWLTELIAESSIEKIRTIHWKYIVTAVILTLAMLITVEQASWGYKAKLEMMSGDPEIYVEEYSIREEILLNSRWKSAEIPEYTVEPMLIYLDDIGKDPTDWRNEGMAKYYEVESIVRIDVD